MNTGSIGSHLTGPPVSRPPVHGLLAALRMLSKTMCRRNPRDVKPEPNPYLYICPIDPAALPFGWRALDQRLDPLARGEPSTDSATVGMERRPIKPKQITTGARR